MTTAEEIRNEWKRIRSELGNLICYIGGKTEQLGDAEKSWQKEYDCGYHRGLEDAWEIAKRVFAEMDYDECIECFGEEFSEDNLTMFDRFSATDTIQMLKKYDNEKAKEKIIRFGDEVEAWDTNSWVQFIAIGDEGDGLIVGFDRGGGSYLYPVESCRKTGKRWKVIEEEE